MKVEFKRSYAIGLLLVAYGLYVYGLYNALVVFEPLKGLSPTDPNRELYRNVFSHVPINATTFTAFTLTLIGSVLYLWKREMKYDTVASSSAKLGLLFSTFTLLTGMIWAKPAWGSYWNWDPRETTVLIMWFIYGAYFALRSATEGEEARARLSALIGIFGFASIPLVYWSAKVTALHPKVGDFELEPMMGMNMGLMITAMLMIFSYLLWLDVKIKDLEKNAKKTN
jgi:heme exporter protein C